MKAKIAVVTVLGKAYYLLVNELKTRGLDFLSFTPYENVPLDIDVVITTDFERQFVKHPKILIYKIDDDPVITVNEAARILEGICSYQNLVVGVDPGKTFGLALLGDGIVLKAFTCLGVEEAMNKINAIFREQPASSRVLKVGNWAPSYTRELLPLLDKNLPADITIEIVSEAGTSRLIGENAHKQGLRHAVSAVKIAERRGQIYLRRRLVNLSEANSKEGPRQDSDC